MLWDGFLVRIEGPDANETKTKDRTFFLMEEGITTLSASGVILETGIILVSGNTLSPYLTTIVAGRAKLIKGTQILISVEVQHNETLQSNARWYSTEFIGVASVGREFIQAATRLVNIRDSKILEETGFGIVGVLKIKNLQTSHFSTSRNIEKFSNSDADERNIQRGDPLTIISSPFGLVSPKVFRNSLTSGM